MWISSLQIWPIEKKRKKIRTIAQQFQSEQRKFKMEEKKRKIKYEDNYTQWHAQFIQTIIKVNNYI